MRILILGGTQFVGRAVAEAALAGGDRVTLFHRGRTNPDAVPGAVHVLGDRDGELGALADGVWDAVIDTSGYVPRVVRQSAEALHGRAGRYLFVSSISVYAVPLAAGFDEASPLAALEDPDTEQVTGATYGGLKVACERVVREAWGDAATIVRPGLVAGPNDPTDRFGYWVRRLAAGGEVLAPAPAVAPVQVIDVRDLAVWMRRLLDATIPGPVHAVGPALPLRLGELLETCRRVSGSDAHVTWAAPEWLVAQGVEPWTELPLWIPGPAVAHHQASDAAARAAGLVPRPIEATVVDTLRYERAMPPERRAQRAGLAMGGPVTREREAELLERWGAREGD